MLLLIQKKIHKNSVRIKAPNSANASKRKHKNQINHYNKQRRVLMANSTVCQSKWKPIVEPRRAKPKTYRPHILIRKSQLTANILAILLKGHMMTLPVILFHILAVSPKGDYWLVYSQIGTISNAHEHHGFCRSSSFWLFLLRIIKWWLL